MAKKGDLTNILARHGWDARPQTNARAVIAPWTPGLGSFGRDFQPRAAQCMRPAVARRRDGPQSVLLFLEHE